MSGIENLLGGDDPTETPSTSSYRGGYITKAPAGLYAGIVKEIVFDEDDFDKGALAYFESVKAPIIDDGGKKKVQLILAKNVPLGEMINLEKHERTPFVTNFGIELKHMPTAGVGVLPLGVGLTGYQSVAQFKDKFVESYDKFVKILNADPTRKKAFVDMLNKQGIPTTFDQLASVVANKEQFAKQIESNPGWIQNFARMYMPFLHYGMTSLVPTMDMLKKQETKFMNLDCYADYKISRCGVIKGEPTMQGALLAVKRKVGVDWVTSVDYVDRSTNGAEVSETVIGEKLSVEEKVKQLEAERAYDKKDGKLAIYREGDVREFVSQQNDSVCTSLRRKKNSPISTVPLHFPANKKVMVAISFGDINPDNNIRENKLIITNFTK